MNKFKNFLNIFTLILIIFNFKVFVQADDDNRIERIESQVQDALIKIKAIEKKNKNSNEKKINGFLIASVFIPRVKIVIISLSLNNFINVIEIPIITINGRIVVNKFGTR